MRLLLLALIVSMLPGCQVTKSLKAISMLKKAGVQKGYFLQEIPFELINNLVVIKVMIRAKVYSFVFDTGAPPTVLSMELAKELQVKTAVTLSVSDANGKKNLQNWSQLDTLSIGGIQFYDAPCISADITAQQVFACMKMDGILGASLMRQAVWSFDFQRKIITVTNSASNLKPAEGATVVSFDPGKTYTPLIDIEVGGKKTGEVINVDMGYSGTLQLGKYYFKEQKNADHFRYITFSVGNSSTGLYGSGKPDTSFYGKEAVNFAGNTIAGQVVTYKKTGPTIIGMQLLKNYNFILDWFNKTITFLKKTEIPAGEIQLFGFASRFDSTGNLMVSEVFVGSDAWQQQMTYGDTIISVNGKNMQHLSKEEQCNIILNGSYNKESLILDIEILRKGEVRALKIARVSYQSGKQ